MLVSVIIPTYNCARFITEAIDSVLKQTYKNFEVIVVDDGSTDDTKKILKDYINKKKIRYIYQENKKLGAARNTGIKNAKGTLIAFLDADDIWMPSKLQRQVPLFMDNKVGLAYADVRLFNNEGSKPGIHTKEFVKGRIFKELMMANFICASSVIVKAECIDRLGDFPTGIDYYGVEDYHMWLRIAYKFKIDYVNETLVNYRIHNSNMSNDYPAMIRREIKVRNGILKMFKINKSLKKDALYDSYSRLAYFFLDDSETHRALKALRMSFSFRPFRINNYKILLKLLLKLAKKSIRM